jgi:excinuclease ABC subunit C
MEISQENIHTEKPILIPSGRENISKFVRRLPQKPGVYKFLDDANHPIYIGKAKLLDKRLSSYFRLSSRTKKLDKLMQDARRIELAITNTELESLLLEQFLIKKLKPKFNVQFKDDKGYPWIKIDTEQKFPSAKSYLGKKQEKGRFLGPFPNNYAVRDALKLIQKTFRLRNCSDSYFMNRSRPCLQYEIGRCSAPCVGLINNDEYEKEVKGAELLLTGRSEELIEEFYAFMDKFSLIKDYEKAAIYRDRISALRDIQRSQSITGFKKNRDAIFLSSIKGVMKIGVTHVKQGWVVGHKNFILQDEIMEEDILERFILQKYLSAEMCPSVLVFGNEVQNKSLLEKALSDFHSKKISIITKPGKKDKGLLDLCRANTEYIFRNDRIDADIKVKIQSLNETLKIKDPIKIIESYDISHQSGTDAVAGCVVYTIEGKDKSLYRTYKISEENSGNDIGSMEELIKRRFSKDNERTLPNLVIIDGGKTHLNSAMKTFADLGLDDLNLVSISKGARRKLSFDSIHLADGQTIQMNSNSVFCRFIQEIRDETHRFAITSLKKRRSKSSIKSSLDNLSGIGSSRKKILLRYFGSLEQIKRASIEDLSEVSGIGRTTAKSIFKQLHS